MSSYKARLRSKFEKKIQRNLAQYWTKRLQIVIVLISITVLVYYKLDCSESLNFFSAQSSAILDKNGWNSNIFNFYHCFRILWAPIKLDCAQNLIFFQRNLAQTWAKWFQIVIFLIFIGKNGGFRFKNPHREQNHLMHTIHILECFKQWPPDFGWSDRPI